MRRAFGGFGVISLLALAACQQMPTGPTASETQYNSYVAQCSAQGGRDRRGQNACAMANSMAMQVSAERSARDQQAAGVAQNNAVTTGVAAGAAGLVGGAVLGNAMAGPHYYGRPYGWGYHRCGWGWC